MSSLFQKSGKPEVTTPTTANPGYISNMENMATGYAGGNHWGGTNPAVDQAMQAYRSYIQSGQNGLNAMNGDPNAVKSYMSPYMAQMNPIFDLFRQQAQTGAMDEATLGGGGGAAFDNSRAAAMRGSAMAGVDQQQAQFNYQGFQDAMQRAYGAAGMGMGAANSLFGGGQYQDEAQQMWQARQLGLLEGGMGPTGTSRPTTYSPLLQLGGLASMIFGHGGIGGGGGGGGGGNPGEG
jgi:hypothetical protein